MVQERVTSSILEALNYHCCIAAAPARERCAHRAMNEVVARCQEMPSWRSLRNIMAILERRTPASCGRGLMLENQERSNLLSFIFLCDLFVRATAY